MGNKYISLDQFSALPPEEQTNLMKQYINDLSAEEQKLLKIMIDNEITASDSTGAV